MKKIKVILLILVLMVIFPLVAYADAGAPMNKYDVIVTNKDGAYLYDYSSEQNGYVRKEYKVAYNTVVRITYELYIGDDLFGGYVCADNENKNCGFINLKNTSPVEVKLEDYRQQQKITFYVFDDTCYLYKGPSEVYEKVEPETVLPVGYEFSTDYYNELWAYVPEKDAWVYTYSRISGSKSMESAGILNKTYSYPQNIITLEEVKIYNNPKTKGAVLGTIPANTKLTTSYYYTLQVHYPFYYITYNGITGFIETIHDNDNGIITNIAYEATDVTLKIKASDGVKLYKESSTKSSVLATIPDGAVIKPIYVLHNSHVPALYKVEYNNQTGWVEYDYEKFVTSDETLPTVPQEVAEEPGPEIVTEPKIIDAPNPNGEKLTVRETVILSVMGVIIVSLLTLVVILLINRKKAIKNADTNTENTN